MAMTRAFKSSLCTGILLLLCASLAKSQVETPRNITLHKPSLEVSTPSYSALNNYGERKLPLKSTTPSSAEIINNSAKPSGSHKNREEQYFESNHDTINNTTRPEPVIDYDKSRQEETSKKHLIEKLIENSYFDEKKADIIPEFNDKEEYSDIEDNEGFGDKEPTTPKSREDGVISLLNDTNINFNNPKKEINRDSTETKNEKITQENATNVISKDVDFDGKLKDPKSQVEIVKETISSKIQRIEEVDKKIDNVITKDLNKTVDEIPVIFVSSESKNLTVENNNTATKIELIEPKIERNSSAKGRTISFGGINEFTSNSEEKAIDKESTELTYTKELRPYPYLKSSTSNSLNVSKPVSTIEEISPLENTIGKSSESNKKLVITEPSVVIDNSIQQIKPTYYKRSGNATRLNIDSLDISTVASAVITTETSIETTNPIENVTTLGSTSTEEVVITTELPNVKLSILPETRATEANLVQNSTEKIPMETATSFDIETSPGDSMLMISPLNVTEETTRAPTTTTSEPTETTTIFSSSSPEFTTITEETLATSTIDEVGTTTLIPEITTLKNLSVNQTESTTAGVEYEFVGLTESKNYEGSSEQPSSSSTSSTESIDLSTLDNTTTEELTTTDFITEVTTLTDVETTTDSTTLIISETTPESSRITENPTLLTTISMSPVSVSGRGVEETSTIGTSTEIVVGSVSSEDSTSTVTNTESTIQVVTDIPWSPEDVNLYVRIVVEGSWGDVCPHLQALRVVLADLLTGSPEHLVRPQQIIFQKNPCTDKLYQSASTSDSSLSALHLYVVHQNGNFDAPRTRMLPNLFTRDSMKELKIRSIQLVQDSDSGNAIAVVVVSCVAFICLVLLAGLLFIMRKRQTRFNYGERCRPVSLDAFSLDSVSAYNSVRRKGANRASKRSYGNPTFEDSTAIPSHPLNFAGLSAFCNEQSAIYEEYSNIPQVSAKIDELPAGAEVKNRYANVIPLPETRVPLAKINNDPLSEYINASYVRGPKNATKYYIACQAPMESTVTDFWRMIWEQQCKVIIMLTDLIENGVEKCAEYVPPSEVTDCHRLYGDFQVTLKKRETKEKYAISTLHLKNLENNTYREISHIWYLWPATGVQSDAAGLIAVLLEARALQRGGPVPIVVHCSPGTGRTGTLIALDLGIRQYEITRTIDVPRVVYTIRRDRAGAVQTKEQYAFIYKALNLYATKLAGGGIEST